MLIQTRTRFSLIAQQYLDSRMGKSYLEALLIFLRGPKPTPKGNSYHQFE